MKRTPDIFRDSIVSRMLRWMACQGEVSSAVFKAEHVALGGTTNSTHAFDRYFEGVVGPFVPSAGSYGILQRQGVGTKGRVRWIGSDGTTFEQRASAWLERVAINVPLPTMRLDAAYFICRANRDSIVELAWCTAIRRTLVSIMPPRHHLLQKLTDAEIENWHGYCEAQAVETGGERAEQWLLAVRQDIARRADKYWASRRSA